MKGEEDSEAVLRGGVEEEGDSTVGLQLRQNGSWQARLRIGVRLLNIGTFVKKHDAQVAFDSGADYRDTM